MADLEQPPTKIASVMEDPSAQAVARVYSEAFLAAARGANPEGGMEGSFEEYRSFLDDVLANQPQFCDLLMSGLVNRDDKVKMIDNVVGTHASPVFVNFLRVLARHERLELLPLVLRLAEAKHEEQSGKRPVRLVAAKPLNDEQLGKIYHRLNEQLPFDPVLRPEVDESLLGGLLIQIGDTVYDSTLRSRMNQLRDGLRRRTLHEIQSGRDRFSHPEGD